MESNNLGPRAYVDYEMERKKKIQTMSVERFVPMSKREDTTVFSLEMIKLLTYGKYQTSWKGVDRMTACTDIVIYEQLLWDVKPGTVIELGTYKGGTALWMADALRGFEYPTHVYSMDLNTTYLDPNAKAPNLTLLKGDSMHIDKTFTPALLQNMPHPWVIIEDAHINVVGVLNYFHDYMETGDYLIIDDTNPICASTTGMGFTTDDWVGFGLDKMKALREFMSEHPNDYRVDTKYTDMFGYNGCWNINGYIKRL